MLRKLSQIVIIGILVLSAQTTLPRELDYVTADLRNEVDDVIFPGENIAVCVDYAGKVNLTAKLQAFAVPGFEELWYREISLGKTHHQWICSIWIDTVANRLYVGNGPLCAVDIRTGDVLWTIEYKDVGIVQEVIPSGNHIVVMGTEKRGEKGITKDFNVMVYETIKNHLNHPKLLCLDKETGEISWQFEYEPLKAFDLSSQVISDDASTFEKTSVYLKGKYIYCLNAVDGSLRWKSEDKTQGLLCLNGDVLYATLDKRPVAINAADGTVRWMSEEKIGEHTIMCPVQQEPGLLAFQPGEEKDGALIGKYKMYALSATDGAVRWKFDKGENLIQMHGNDTTVLFMDEKKCWLVNLVNGEVLMESKTEKNYCHGILLMEQDGRLTLGKKGIKRWRSNLKGNSKELTWEYEAEQARHGGGFLSAVFDGLMKVVTGEVFLASVGISEKAAYRKGTFTSTDYGTIGYKDTIIVFPTHDKGIQAISVADGSTLWQVDIKNDPFPYYSPSLDYMLVPMKKQIHFVNVP